MPNSIATAYIRLLPDASGIVKSVSNELNSSSMVTASKSAGEKIAGGLSSAASKLMPVSLGLAAIGTAGVKSFAEVDKTMQLTNKTMGNTADEADLLNKAMKDAASNSTFGMKDAATATLNFARAGLDAEQAAAALAPSMNIAAGEGGNLDTVSAGLVATINGFHGSFEDAGHYADVFAAACNNSALDVNSLSGAMSIAAPIFSAAGYNINDAALYMGVMANNGIDANVAANSLKTGLARLVSPANEGAKMMKELGISITNADGTMKDSVTIQRELHDAFGKLSESEQIAAASAIFGKNQMAPWLALINTAPEDVGKLDASLESCAGTTEEMANAMMSGFGGSMESLKSSIDVLVTSLGEALAPTIQKAAEFVKGLADKFNSLTPAQQETVVKIGAIVAAAGPLLGVVSTVITSVGNVSKVLKGAGGLIGHLGEVPGAISKVITAGNNMADAVTNTVGSAFQWFSTQSTAWGVEIGAFGTAVIGVADAILIAYDVNKLKEAWSTYHEALLTHNREAEQALSNYAKLYQTKGKEVADQWAAMVYQIDTSGMKMDEAQKAIAAKVESYWDGVPQNMWDGFKQGWDHYFGSGSGGGIIGLGKDAFTSLINGVKNILGIHSPSTVFSGIGKDLVNGLSKGLSEGWNTITKWLSTAAASIINAFKNLPSNITIVGRNIAGSLASGISNGWSTARGALQSVGSTLSSWMQNLNTTKNTMVTIGSNLMTGLANGIISAASTAWEAAKSAAASLVDGVKGVFGVQSPSKVFAEIGAYLDQGLAQGIAGNSNVVDNALKSLSSGLIADARVNMSTGMYSPSGSGAAPVGRADLEMLVNMLTDSISKMTVTMNNGALVGQITTGINQGLGDLLRQQSREVMA